MCGVAVPRRRGRPPAATRRDPRLHPLITATQLRPDCDLTATVPATQNACVTTVHVTKVFSALTESLA
ncbi:hypothetical protein RR46_09119 [Papilio xuthus]|uniref:Uncharacterized protein n=1 Tax=Papilio xuthus TaxID=66420 RepID=A0A194PV64_PAPXU|nr:hypothetical protein RR46_09119 [Papilio xuthus]